MKKEDFMTEIVGESFYADTLNKCYFSKKAIDCDGGKVIEVGLKKINDNPHDNNAVAIFSPFGQIGHLSRNDAKKYRQIVTSNGIKFVKCRIWSSNPADKIFGAWIDFDLDNPPAKPKRKKFLGIF
nr:HIRAN domain-containing protein [uncultured Moraxella sp.]